MSKISKTARASMGQQAPKEKVVLTEEVAIKEIRNLRAGHLAVLNVEYIDLLLAAYDRVSEKYNTLHQRAFPDVLASL
jgi:hypothetical protein